MQKLNTKEEEGGEMGKDVEERMRVVKPCTH